MAVDFGKLNKAGLGASSFGTRKTRGASSQAAQNLANTTTATKSSLFSFKGTRMNNWVPGQHINKNMHKYNYQGMRASMNSRTFTPSYAGPAGSIGHMHGAANNIGSVTYNNDFAKGMIIGQTVAQGINLLNQLGVFGGNNGGGVSSVGSKLSSALGSLGGGGTSGVTSANVANVINSMSSATDSASLRSAINSAKAELESINQKVSEAATNTSQLVDQEEADVKDAEKDVKSKRQDVSKASEKVRSQTNVRDSKQLALDNAEKDLKQKTATYNDYSSKHEQAKQDVTNKTTIYNNAKAATQSAKDQLASMAADDPGRAALEAKIVSLEKAEEAAKKDLEKAEKTEQDLASKLEAAETAKKRAEEAIPTAKKELEDAKTNLAAAELGKENAEKDLDKANEDLEVQEAELKEAETQHEDVEALKADQKILQDSITDQEDRLVKLIAEEEKQYAKLDEKIDSDVAKNDKRSDKIDSSNGLSWREKRLAKKMGLTNEEIASNSKLRDGLENNVDTSFILKQTPTATVGGFAYRTGTNPLTGNTVYAKDNQLITEEEFKAATGANV